MLGRFSRLFTAPDRSPHVTTAKAERAPEVSVRPAEHRDLDSVMDMISALVVHHDQAPNISVEQLAAEALGERPSVRILVAEAHGMLVGYVLLQSYFNAISGERSTNIDHLFVVAEHRQRGIGKRLVEAALDTARDQGCRHVFVQSDIHNWAAHAFYAATGFLPYPSSSRRFWRSI